MQSKRYDTGITKLGERVKQIRTQKGMSQLELASACEMDRSDISRIENGRVDLRLSSLIKVAEGLEVELHELFEKEK